MFGIKAAVVGAKRILSDTSRIEPWRSGNASPVPLLPSLADADCFRAVRFASIAHLRAYQPHGLRKKAE